VSTEWVLHCATSLAQLEPGATAPAARLAEYFDVPAAYLAKQLQALVRAHFELRPAGHDRRVLDLGQLGRAAIEIKKRRQSQDKGPGGAGLGIRFLKHLQRTRVLLHLVDIAPVDPNADPVRDAISIVGELGKFSADLLDKPRWLVLNKSDLLPPEEAAAKAVSIALALKYRGPAFLISGVTQAGTKDLTEAVMGFIESGEAPAQGNLPLPVVKAPRRTKAAAPKAKAKAKAKVKKKPAKKKAAKKKTKAKKKTVARNK